MSENIKNGKKEILTTGQVAQICKVAPRTVTKWFDSGQLKGYRIPGGRDRRIPAAELLRFMKAHNMPTGQIEMHKIRILIIDSDWQNAEMLAKQLAKNSLIETETASSGFDAGLIAQKLTPHIIFININSENIDAAHICKNVRSNPDLQATKLVAIAEDSKSALSNGYDYCLADTSDFSTVLDIVNQATSIVD